jgi:integral membrane protein
VSGSLRRYRVMAVVVSIALFVLLVGMFLRYVLGHPEFSEAYSPIHGALYMVYLVTVAHLGTTAGWSLRRTVGVMVAGAVPVVSYVVERRVAHEERARQQGAPSVEGAPAA